MLTTRQFAARYAEFQAIGVEVVRVFHSPLEALAAFANLPFPLLADPKKRVYRLYGVRPSFLSLLRPSAYRRVHEARKEGLRPRWRDALRDGFQSTPADFVVAPDGRLAAAHLGAHFTDSWTPDFALAECRRALAGSVASGRPT